MKSLISILWSLFRNTSHFFKFVSLGGVVIVDGKLYTFI